MSSKDRRFVQGLAVGSVLGMAVASAIGAVNNPMQLSYAWVIPLILTTVIVAAVLLFRLNSDD